MPLQKCEDNAQAPNSDDDFVQGQRVHTMRIRRDREKRKAAEALQNKENDRPRLTEDEEEEEKEEEGYVSTFTAPRSKRILRASRQNKRSLLNDDEDDDDDQGSNTSIATTTTASLSRREVPWSLFANKDSVLVLGDWNEEDGEYVQDDDEDFWWDKSCGNTDSSEDEYADEIDTGGTRVHPVPVMRQIYESNQYGEMLSRAAQFGKPYLALGDQERQNANTIKRPCTMDSSSSASNPQGFSHNLAALRTTCDIPGTSRERAISGNTIRNNVGSIPGRSSASSLRGFTTATNNICREMKRPRRGLCGSSGSGEKAASAE
ncbi:hypothetical protein BG006_011393 [Podila minutissima]|uniref:Uncharacterized protein n=1 Tax=Podila minutissima TaxID=64525 RepID=A0A9P5VHZ8_9FUNG|nr:hypothetical protein BG006_011393 [Podila minutissima]